MLGVGSPLSRGNLFTFIAAWTLISPLLAQECFWFKLGKEWPGGKKGHLLVPMTSEVDGGSWK